MKKVIDNCLFCKKCIKDSNIDEDLTCKVYYTYEGRKCLNCKINYFTEIKTNYGGKYTFIRSDYVNYKNKNYVVEYYPHTKGILIGSQVLDAACGVGIEIFLTIKNNYKFISNQELLKILETNAVFS